MKIMFSYQFNNKNQGEKNQLLTTTRLGKQNEKHKIKSLS